MTMAYCKPFKRGVGYVSQRFGTNPNNGVNPGGGHTGDDWAVPVGTPVHAAADGIIRNSSWLSENYLENPWWLTRMGGDTLVLDATDAFGRSETMPTFVYAHLSDSTAQVGQRVKKGQVIGYSGNTGTATTGPHCHAEVLPPAWDWNNGTYGRVDPELWLTEYADDFELAMQASAIIPITPIETKESEMPKYKRVANAGKINHRLPKGGVYRLSAKDDGLSQNFAVNGPGHYGVDLFISGTDLPAGEALTVTFEVVRQGKPSRYFEQDIAGTKSGEFKGHVSFNGPVEGALLNVAVVSSVESARVTGFGADVATWRKG